VLSFTTQERRILLFLAVSLLLGGILRWRQNHQQLRELEAITPAHIAPPPLQILTAPQDSDLIANPLPNLIDINEANERELATLPGIGLKLARRIVTYRQKHGKFKHLHDIQRVRGIGPALYRRIAPRITISK